jgi:hypothetical protein
MDCGSSTSSSGSNDQYVVNCFSVAAHTLRMSASLSARFFSSSAMNRSRIF